MPTALLRMPTALLLALTATAACGSPDQPTPNDPSAPPPVAPDGARPCTQIGCGPAFSVAFQRPSPWKSGTYRVTVTADGKEATCTATFPLACDAPPPCPADAGFQLGLSGCALPPAQHSLSGIDFSQGTRPAKVDVKVFEADAPIGAASYTPAYTSATPNGPGCEPACTGAPPVTLTLQ
ncbi:hypothetical protein [Chondromyces apiculatus]|uniref:Lipoprotein n=1 Tax=Chondromyces apiculatus DSM 436 TaxID=1192034 RepID=A0A017T7B2_9BACT|nr:hypothetical protein [Chondromyces apiculatus]EYF05104.1 Hypothetical protein CAP_3694 [Chondromyces apiculatus DSM 436]